MRKTFWKRIVTLGVAVIMAFGVTACASTTNAGGTQEAKTSGTTADTTAGTQEVRVIKAARVFAAPPYNYNDENGYQTGFETEVIRAAFELLPQYKLEFVDTTDEELLVGIQEGKYDLGFKTAWWTQKRAENYAIPNQDSGVTTVGVLIRAEDAEKYSTFDAFAKEGGRLVPIAPSNGQYAVIQAYNEAHKDAPIKLEAAESFDATEAYTWVLEGRYDGYLVPGHKYKANVVEENGPYHQYADKLGFVIYEAIPTYPLFNLNNKDITEEYDKAIEQLKANGTIEELEKKFFGEDLYQYVTELSNLR